MSKTISISDELESKIIRFCDDELNYHINESGCPDEYQDEILAQIELLRLLGKTDMADQYEEENKAHMEEFTEDKESEECGDQTYRVIFPSAEERDAAENTLDEVGCSYDYDSDDRMMVDQCGLNFLDEYGIDYDEI